MRPEIELSLAVEFDQLFAFRDRIRPTADRIRAQLYAAGLPDRLETEVFDEELELRGPDGSRLLVQLDSYHLEITGALPELQVHLLACLILEEAEVFRLNSVEAGFSMAVQVKKQQQLNLVQRAFSPVAPAMDEPMLDRRFGMTWEWGTATTGYSFFANDTEDRELFLGFKAREGYMTLPELKSGIWITNQAQRFDGAVERFLSQLNWKR